MSPRVALRLASAFRLSHNPRASRLSSAVGSVLRDVTTRKSVDERAPGRTGRTLTSHTLDERTFVEQNRIREQLAAQGRQVKALQQYAATAHLRYDNGYTSYIEVLDAQRSRFGAQLQYIQTRRAQLQSMIQLYKTMGEGWIVDGEIDR